MSPTNDTRPTTIPGVRSRLRILLAGLAALLLCSLYIGWASLQERQADQSLDQHTRQTLQGLDQVSAGQRALTALRRNLGMSIGSETTSPASAPAWLADYRRTMAPLAPLQSDQGRLLDEVATALVATARDADALLRAGDLPGGRRKIEEFPRIGEPAEARLRDLAAGLQAALHGAQAVREEERYGARRLALASLILLAVVVLGAVALVARSVLPPLDRIHTALSRVSRGEALDEPPVRGQDEFGQIGRAVLELSRLNADLRDLAFIDPLTRLPNRASFEADLQGRLGKGEPGVLVFADLDRFRNINDGFGHHFGDDFLRAASARLRGLAGPGSSVYRYSADLFVLLLPAAADASQESMTPELERLRQGMAELGSVQERRLPFCCSFGATMFPQDGNEPEALVSAADAAMFQAKRQGRNSVQFARGNFAKQVRHRLDVADELRIALREGHVMPYFQPIIDLAVGEVVCAEALARWKHPTRGFIPPDEFIGVAEDSGQIDALTDHLLRGACTAAAQWHASGIARRLAFNLSARQVRPGVVEMIAGVLRDTGLPPEKLEVEITESAIIERPELAERLLRELRGIGVAVALDDFGTGYSSLSYLLRFPIDKIKVDRSFVSQLEGQRQAAKIVAATIALASSLEITLVAEGVERLGQMLTLYELGCRQQQGWLFAKALPAAEFERWALSAPLRLDAVVRSQMDASNEPISSAA